MKEVKIRQYRPSDKEEALEIFDMNTPMYFAPDERDYFEQFLDRYSQNFFTVVRNEEILGFGGHHVSQDGKEAELAWGMIRPEWQRKGIGTRLVTHRMTILRETKGLRTVSVQTSQNSYEFYVKMEFELVRTEEDHWGDGLDLYYMERAL